MTATWSFINSPELNGKVAVITGANSGLGFETARALRQKGATVVMACRSEDKAQAAIAKLEKSAMGPSPEFVQLDLEDLASVARAAATITEAHPAVDFLINNAGVMGLKGPDGPQRQLNANYLGHVALTAALLPAVEKAGGRIVMLSSNLHRRGKLNKETPLDLSKQSPAIAYGSTKLADLLFCFDRPCGVIFLKRCVKVPERCAGLVNAIVRGKPFTFGLRYFSGLDFVTSQHAHRQTRVVGVQRITVGRNEGGHCWTWCRTRCVNSSSKALKERDVGLRAVDLIVQVRHN